MLQYVLLDDRDTVGYLSSEPQLASIFPLAVNIPLADKNYYFDGALLICVSSRPNRQHGIKPLVLK